jgi:hypothetical protein
MRVDRRSLNDSEIITTRETNQVMPLKDRLALGPLAKYKLYSKLIISLSFKGNSNN